MNERLSTCSCPMILGIFASMGNLKLKWLLTFLLALPAVLPAQQPDKHPAKAPPLESGKLQDGVYLSHAEARLNTPSLFLNDLFKSYYDSVFTIYQWARTKKLYYHDTNGRRTSLGRDSIWGFSEDGQVYLCFNGYFHKVTLFGAFCLFREYYPTQRDPLSIVVTDKRGEIRDRIYDFENGRVGDYDMDNVATLLMRDEALFTEFNEITNLKVKRRKMFSFIERYNERHPVLGANATH